MTVTEISAYCPMCQSMCGCKVSVEDGRILKVNPDPTHPTGSALCGKGRSSVDLVYADQRLERPLRRTAPKDAEDPGWVEVGWDEALDDIAGRLARIARESGPEAVTFGSSTPSGTSMVDSFPWLDRLAHVFGSPNFLAASTELCQWHRDDAYAFTFGAPQPLPDFSQSGCLLLWGHNPRASWLSRLTRVMEANKNAMALIVVDPRKTSLAAKADVWLRVRPGADAAVALALAGELIRKGAADVDFLAAWTTAPALVRSDTGGLLRAADLDPAGDDALLVLGPDGAPVPQRPGVAAEIDVPATEVALASGDAVGCRTVYSALKERALEWTPERAEAVAWVDADAIRRAAELISEQGPISHASWTGVNQGTNVTQTARAISCLYAMTGDWDAPGGNVEFAGVPVELPYAFGELSSRQSAKAIGVEERPLGPAAAGMVGSRQLWPSILEGRPYRTRAFLGFGINPIMTHADPAGAAEALRALEFHVQVDQVLTPTARFADYVLPANTHWERESVQAGFGVDEASQRTVQWRPAVIPPRGESRSDLEIACELADRLGIGDSFGGRTPRELHERFLAPSGITVKDLEAADGHRIVVDNETRYRKYADPGPDGTVKGFPTASGRVELFVESFAGLGEDPLPAFREPAVSPYTLTDEEAKRFPLVLTSAKLPQFCHSEHRGLPKQRRAVREPGVTLHPDCAAAKGLEEGDWVRIVSPKGQVKARLELDANLDPRVAVGQYGWWEPCPELDEPGYPPLARDGSSANFGLLIGGDHLDPISGSQPLRQYVCDVELLG